MCTAVSFTCNSHFFGRNLDLQYGYREQVVITPRDFPFRFRSGYLLPHHYAMIGMATVANGEPLYYEATNEHGLSIAGLNFPHSAQYQHKAADKDNIAPYELIPWILGQCETVKQAKRLLQRVNIWALPYSREFPLTPLHWMIADKDSCIVAEPVEEGLKIYDDPVGVLTNEPSFPYHMLRLSDFMQLQPGQAENRFPGLSLKPYSNGMGAMGLPGDYSSVSRFVRAAYVRCNSISQTDDLSQFFHILSAVAMPSGSVHIDGDSQITRYACCCDTEKGIYYYTTYDNSRLRAVSLRNADIKGQLLTIFDLMNRQDIFWQN